VIRVATATPGNHSHSSHTHVNVSFSLIVTNDISSLMPYSKIVLKALKALFNNKRHAPKNTLTEFSGGMFRGNGIGVAPFHFQRPSMESSSSLLDHIEWGSIDHHQQWIDVRREKDSQFQYHCAY
jgi:hypothetical protein